MADTTTTSNMPKEEATAFLRSLLNKNLRVTTTDARMFWGSFKCTDPVSVLLSPGFFCFFLPSFSLSLSLSHTHTHIYIHSPVSIEERERKTKVPQRDSNANRETLFFGENNPTHIGKQHNSSTHVRVPSPTAAEAERGGGEGEGAGGIGIGIGIGQPSGGHDFAISWLGLRARGVHCQD
jgi:hypothetical protein